MKVACLKKKLLRIKSMVEKVQLIDQLVDENKKTIFPIIDKMLINKKLKDFFKKYVAALYAKTAIKL